MNAKAQYRANRTKYWIRKIVKNPWLQFAVGLIMLISSFEGQQGQLYTDLVNFKFKVHHGVNFMGLWQMLQALPNLWDSVNWMLSKWLED